MCLSTEVEITHELELPVLSPVLLLKNKRQMGHMVLAAFLQELNPQSKRKWKLPFPVLDISLPILCWNKRLKYNFHCNSLRHYKG